MAQKKWGPQDVKDISQEMVKQNRGKNHGYSDLDIERALRKMEKQFMGKSIASVAREIFSILGGGGNF